MSEEKHVLTGQVAGIPLGFDTDNNDAIRH